MGLIPQYNSPRDRHETIYNAHYRYRPKSIPDWVDPRKCIFGYMNRARQGGSDGIVDGKVSGVTIGIEVADHVRRRDMDSLHAVFGLGLLSRGSRISGFEGEGCLLQGADGAGCV